jgi:hypothetical protein
MLRRIDFQKVPKNLNDFMYELSLFLLVLAEDLSKTSKNIDEKSKKDLENILSEWKTPKSSVWIWILVALKLLALACGIEFRFDCQGCFLCF